MTDTGFIKLYRTTLDNVVSSDARYLGVWAYLLMLANHEDNEVVVGYERLIIKKGETLTSVDKLSKKLKLNRTTLRRMLSFLSKQQMLNIKTTSKYSVITILNYNKYNSVEQQVNIKRTSNEQQMNTNKNDKNDKNILSKDNKVKDRNEVVDFVLEQFKTRYGFSPIDKKPRQVAYNIGQITNTFIKNYGAIYEVKKGEKADVQTIIARVFDKFLEEDFAKDTQYLDTFKRHLKKILEITGNKLTQVTNSPSVQ